MWRSLKVVLFLLVVLLVLAGCIAPPVDVATGDTGAAPAEAGTADSGAHDGAADLVKVVSLPFITFAPFYIGVEEGYFADQGIDVEIVDMRVQEEILPALASGQVDVTSGLVSAGMFNAIARGANVKITADKGVVDPEGCINWSIAGRSELIENGELEDVAQIAGRTVNIVPATWLEYYLAKVLETGGLTLDDIEKVNLSSWSMPDALAQGSIDLAVNSEPWVTRFNAAGHFPVFQLPQEILPDDSGAVILFGPKLLDENRDLGVRFMTAYLRAVRQYQEGKTARNLEIIADFSELEPELLEEMCWPAIRTTGEVNTDSALAFEEWAVARGYQDSVVAPEQFYDGSYVEAANTLLGAGQ
jgi:NitT/TauT family transport system substrate-binding protein